MKIGLFSLMLAAFCWSSCSKSPACWGKDKNNGTIKEALTIECWPVSPQAAYSITTQERLEFIFDSENTTPLCELPDIDFETESLLGLYTQAECETKYIREVEESEVDKNITFKVTIKSCGECNDLDSSYNWVVIPKIPSDYTVKFETITNSSLL